MGVQPVFLERLLKSFITNETIFIGRRTRVCGSYREVQKICTLSFVHSRRSIEKCFTKVVWKHKTWSFSVQCDTAFTTSINNRLLLPSAVGNLFSTQCTFR